MSDRVKRSIAVVAAQRSNQIPAVVIDVLGPRCSIRLSNASGRVMRNLRYSGATPDAGQDVFLIYRGGTPVVETNSPNINDAVGNATITNITQVVGGGGGDTEAQPPEGTTSALITSQALFTMEGILVVGSKPIRIYNKYGGYKTISQVFLSAETAPTGAAIIVDVNKGGTTIFTTQSNRPQIAAAANTGFTTTIEVAEWADGEYLTFDIDQVGSTIPGSNLTVHIIFS